MPQAASRTTRTNHKGVPTRHNGQAIRDLRISEGIEVRDLAAKVGLSRKGLLNVETGVRDTRPEVLARIAKALGVEVAVIMRTPRRANGNGPERAA